MLSRALEPMHRLHEELACWRQERMYAYRHEVQGNQLSSLLSIYGRSTPRPRGGSPRPWRALGRILRGKGVATGRCRGERNGPVQVCKGCVNSIHTIS